MKADIFYNEDTKEAILTLRAESNAEGAALKLLGKQLGFEVEDPVGSTTCAYRRAIPEQA